MLGISSSQGKINYLVLKLKLSKLKRNVSRVVVVKKTLELNNMSL
jgi:hypothetical protein